MVRRLFCALMADRSSSFQLDGAPDNASTAACVGIWRYGIVVAFVSTGACLATASEALCRFAACFASLILDKMDISITNFGDFSK